MKVDIYDEDCVSEEEVPEFFSGKNLKQIKQSIFENIVKGDFSNEEIEPTLKQLIENYNLSLGNQTGFFFTFLLQTLDWRLPVMAIHLSQSETGHISISEIANFKKLLYRLSIKNNIFQLDISLQMVKLDSTDFIKQLLTDILQILKMF